MPITTMDSWRARDANHRYGFLAYGDLLQSGRDAFPECGGRDKPNGSVPNIPFPHGLPCIDSKVWDS